MGHFLKTGLMFVFFLTICLVGIWAHAQDVPPPTIVEIDAGLVVKVDAGAVTLITKAEAELPNDSVGGFKVPDLEAKEVPGYLGKMKQAKERGDYATMASILLMIVVAALKGMRKEWAAQHPEALPWIAVGIGCATGIWLSLQLGLSLYESLFAGLLIGAASSGFYSLIGKYIFKSPVPKSP